MWMSDGHGLWGLGGVFMILFWVLVVLAIAALVRWLALGPGRPGEGPDTPKRDRPRAMELLEERYARGEIDREEFLQKKQDLEP
ncbi:hypothetical protein AN478_10815 [Thiohalorhabdus denitrificans]|uniref:Putative membrane protein n=1 Tax=Thiohalorhabdus denitrificans TaxID=381306 RepID=A0A0N8PMT4_9GAMM|nr:SHOCT domain-containing protein [Thiohalorhabdus denitrificans]KPV39613.1 hypothetical protein AN478_10815 [Thiohalorhabdus denitrificans]SCX96777.1 putative membrane protein [Thiohalorhabdus denitrificans]